MAENTIPEHLVKALEFSKDWSTWLVGLQTAIIAGIVLSLGKPTESALRFQSMRWLRAALVFFGLSIAIATWVNAGIPTIVWRLKAETPDVFSYALFSGFPSVPIWWATTAEHWLFGIGFLCLLKSLRVKG